MQQREINYSGPSFQIEKTLINKPVVATCWPLHTSASDQRVFIRARKYTLSLSHTHNYRGKISYLVATLSVAQSGFIEAPYLSECVDLKASSHPPCYCMSNNISICIINLAAYKCKPEIQLQACIKMNKTKRDML